MTDTFDELARYLDALAVAVHSIAMTASTWTPGSPAAHEVAANTFGGAWADNPVHETLMLSVSLLTHTNDHLHGIAATIREPGVVMAPISLLRPTLESTAMAYYLLAPDIELRERVRRGMNLLLRSYGESLTVARAAGGEPEFHYRQRIVWMRMGAERHGFVVHKAKRSPAPDAEPVRWIDTPVPSDQRLIRDLLDDDEGNIGALVHRMTSAVLHGQIHGVQLFLGRHSFRDAEEGTGYAEVGQSLGDLGRWSGAVLYGLHRLMLRACAHYGWDEREWQSVAQPALVQWRAWLDLPSLPRGPVDDLALVRTPRRT